MPNTAGCAPGHAHLDADLVAVGGGHLETSRLVGEAMPADGTGPGKHEAGSVEGPENQAGYHPMQLFGLTQAVAPSSGNRLSHRLRTRADKISSGHIREEASG